jgi:Ca2+-transporting ATPase
MEVALLAAGEKAGLTRRELLEAQPEEREEAFDPETSMMATFHRVESGLRVAVKGAPEAVISACTRVRAGDRTEPFDERRKEQWLERNTAIAADGLRVLALATKRAESRAEVPYADLVLVGLVGLVDPPREDVRGVIERCRAAGIRIVMITGDQAVTARHIANAVGLVDGTQSEVLPGSAIEPPEKLGPDERERLLRTAIFARVSPRQKLDLIALHQANREIVAMTGDGVNDAPALKKADIGVAMGQRGTQVAREAADMVLRDDAFRTIVVAVEQGRVIFDNIRKFVLYLLSCNVSEVLIVGLATLANAPLPILPLQILFLNLVTDVFPALALGVGPGDPHIMSRRPRPAGEPILARQHWIAVSAYGMLITAATLGAFWLALEWFALAPAAAVTVSFLTLALAQLWQVFNMREPETGIVRNDIVANPYIWGALLLCAGLLAAAVYFAPLATVLGISVPDTASWLLIITASLLPWAVGQLYLFARGRAQKRANYAS